MAEKPLLKGSIELTHGDRLDSHFGPPIAGSTILTLREQLRHQFWALRRIAPKLALSILVAATILILIIDGPTHMARLD
jgi:hypothetical protein